MTLDVGKDWLPGSPVLQVWWQVTLWIWNFQLRGERQPLPCFARHDHLSGRNMDTERQLHTYKDNDRVSGFSYRKHTSSVTEVEQNCISPPNPKLGPPSEITTSSQLCIYWRRDFASITKTTDWAAEATAFIKSCCGGTHPGTQLSSLWRVPFIFSSIE